VIGTGSLGTGVDEESSSSSCDDPVEMNCPFAAFSAGLLLPLSTGFEGEVEVEGNKDAAYPKAEVRPSLAPMEGDV
jgi:hypothetical protein